MNGFDVCSIQFAIHYMFESSSKLHNFLRNVSETTKIGGFFIGTSYDGSKIFHMLKDKEKGESVTVQESGEQIWQVTKQYENDEFVANSSSGYAIDVYQETINKVFTEYLVNYDYLANVLRNYGFEPEQNLIRRTGFKEIYTSYLKTIKNDSRKNPMSYGEKQISFLNRVFIFKKFEMWMRNECRSISSWGLLKKKKKEMKPKAHKKSKPKPKTLNHLQLKQ